MIRVLAVIDSTAAGGAETSMAGLAPLMRNHGIELELAYFHERPGIKARLVAAKIPVWHVPFGSSRLSCVRRLKKLIDQRRPEVVHTMVFEADIIGRTAGFLAGVPVISSIISEHYGPAHFDAVPSRLRLHFAKAVDQLTAKTVTEWHAVTRAVAAQMAPRLQIDTSNITVIPRGRSVTEFAKKSPERRRDIRFALGIGEMAPFILAVGRHDPPKGLEILLDAMPLVLRDVPAVRLAIAGRSGLSTHLIEDRIRTYRLADVVSILGHRSDIADLLAAADVLAFPSKSEGIGGAVIEAMMMGCRVVCSDLPALREIAEYGNAVQQIMFVPVGDVQALATALVEMVIQGDTKTTVVDQGALGYFDVDHIAAQHADQYRRVAASRRRHRRVFAQPF